MRINLGFLFSLFRGVREAKRDVAEIKEGVRNAKMTPEERNNKRNEWLKNVTINEIVTNVKTTITECGLYEKYGEKLKIDADELSLEIAIGLDDKSYTKTDIKNAFDEGIGPITGVIVDRDMLNEIAEYYYTNFYDAEKQKEFYEIGRAKREEYK